jgi:aryl-alcohol dehydrogenase-like predicted oxidoreductase
VPLFGTRSVTRFEENIGALSVNLTRDDLIAIDEGAAKVRIVGDRYPTEMMNLSGL